MRRALALLIVCVAASGAIAAAANASGGLTLTPAGGARFPDRSFVLSLPPNTSVPQGGITVTENGKPVPSLTVSSASAEVQRRFGVVLVIDASRSMTHKPIESAMAAARTFAKHRNAQMPLGVVTFNGSSLTRLPLTTDSKQIDNALATPPPLARETHIYDAVYGALALLHRAGATAGSVVVLSDGADTGSKAKATDVVHWARQYGIRIFPVGLHSGAFTAAPLRALASGSLGEYAEASSPNGLAPIYDQLGAKIASQYLITYRSLARPHRHVVVRARAAGFSSSASLAYVTPGIPRHPGGAVRTVSAWRSPATMALVVLLCATLLAVAMALVLRPNPAGIRARMARFISPEVSERDENGNAGFATRALSGAEESLEGIGWWERLKEDLEIARIQIPASHLILWTFIGTIGLFALAVVVTGSALLAILTLGAPLGVRAWVQWKLAKQRKLFAEQLADTLQVVASAMRAGHSFAAALGMGVDDSPEPTRRELRRVVVDEQLGVSIEDSLAVVARRMKSDELDQVIVVVMLQRDTGGNTAEVLEHVTGAIRERMELVHTGAGHLMLVLAGLMIYLGSSVIKRMIDIKV
jgi:tight adherence protein B